MPRSSEAAIVGVAESGIGMAPDRTALELMGEASIAALGEAGLSVHEVDGLFAQTPYLWHPSMSLGEHLGIVAECSDTTNLGGASFGGFVNRARLAIERGECRVALVAYGSTQASDGGRLVTGSERLPFEEPYGTIYPLTSYALAAQRHMAMFGTTSRQLAQVAVAAREWARQNPVAVEQDPLSVEDVLASRIIASPLHERDCCLVTDGGGAVVMTSLSQARDLPQPPIVVLGSATAWSHRQILEMDDLTTTQAVRSSEAALGRAGVDVTEVDFVQIYDSFTINVVLALEDLGFCAKGEGGAFIEHCGIGPSGSLPVNTSGGGLSYCHPGMFGIFLFIEAVRQLRHECGARQVPGAEVGLVHAIGGVLAAHSTAVLGCDRR